MAKEYKGASIAIGFEMKRCIHARNCYLKLPRVFDPDRRPWVDPDAASAEEIAAMIRTCPSGALTFRRLDNAADEATPGINRVSVQENGPNAFHGNLVVAGEAMTRATICRCGKTKNPPYCDYSHVDAGFIATGEPPETGKDAPGEDPGEELIILGHENGPIEARGALEVTSGTGRRVHRGTRAFLCRCGHSNNKPFCDGSHKRVGFEMPGD
ncbi:MAG: iron-binding protein [Silicimonas sp.]|nr:iron-binding protein [Silicimonas sp.]